MNSDIIENNYSEKPNVDFVSLTYDSNLTLATYNEQVNAYTRKHHGPDTVATMTEDENTDNMNAQAVVYESIQKTESPTVIAARKAAFKSREEALKHEYYKSNPLRNYAPTRGQTILPHNFVFQNLKQASSGNISESSLSGINGDSNNEHIIYQFKNKKKSLPKVYKDLRTTKNIEEDRELHKQKLRTILKLNLTEFKKNPVDLQENSKKTYTEYCRNNLERPINLNNVESVLKSIINTSKPNTTLNKKDVVVTEKNDLEDYSGSIDDYYSSYRASNQHKIGKMDANFLVDAQTLSIKGIEEMSKEMKSRKAKLAKMDLNTDAKHCFRTANTEQVVRNVTNNLENIENHFNKHKGSIYNYRLASKAASKQSNRNLNNSEEMENFPDVNLHTNSDIDDDEDTILQQQQQNEANRLIQARSMIIFADDEKEQLMKRKEKNLQRIAQARHKILSDPAIKNNLNKMTILQPFEDTKILINIDKVPSKILNSLLNKQNTAPRYYMPPVRAFGYFRNVINTKQTIPNISNRSIENANPFTPCSSRSSANITRRRNNTNNQSNYSRSAKQYNNIRSSSQRSIKYESLQTLSQSQNPFYTNSTSSSKEAFKYGKNSNNARNEEDISNLKQNNRSTSLNGISIK